MKTKHTKEWRISRVKHSKNIDKGGFIYINSDNWVDMVRIAFLPDELEQSMEIAKIIEASPEMLKLLIRIFDTVNLADYSMVLYNRTKQLIETTTS